jgi:outer membrane immunogenic protein
MVGRQIMKSVTVGLVALSLVVGSSAFAADMGGKAPPPVAPPAGASWTGFYLGGEIGGGWTNRAVSYAGNDPAANSLVGGLLPTTGDQPLFPDTFNMSGVTGGFEAGYNWQVDRAWLVGIETDFNGSSLKGTGNSTSVLQSPPVLFTQTVSEQQKVEWYGTVRGRLGFLPTDNLLLFASGGFAYGRVANSGTYSGNGVAGVPFQGTLGGFSFSCTTNTACFVGSSSSIKTGFTVGGGIEWLLYRNWSLKAEYQYVNLGSDALRLTANAVVAGNAPASFNANFARDDFHVVRAGVNYHF